MIRYQWSLIKNRSYFNCSLVIIDLTTFYRRRESFLAFRPIHTMRVNTLLTNTASLEYPHIMQGLDIELDIGFDRY